MTRYFFHARNGGELILDTEGVDLPDSDSAADECRRIVREVLNEDAFRGEPVANGQFEITDELGRLVLIIPFLPGPLV